jgi:hypothetical protein
MRAQKRGVHMVPKGDQTQEILVGSKPEPQAVPSKAGGIFLLLVSLLAFGLIIPATVSGKPTTQPFAGQLEATDTWTGVEFPAIDGPSSPVVIGSISTFHGKDTAALRMRNVGTNGMDVFIEEEESADQETNHVKETIQFVGFPIGAIQDASGRIIGEAGTTKVEQPDREHWHSVSLNDAYSNPVVFMQIMSYQGSHPSHIRVRNVRSNGFEFQIEEWSTYKGAHTQEKIGYIVIEQGSHKLADGTPIEVRTKSASHSWSSLDFQSKLGGEPSVISQSQTRHGAHEIVTRHRNLNAQGVDIRLQEEEGRDGEHVKETVGLLAMNPGQAGLEFGRVEKVSHVWKAFDFESRTGTSPAVLSTIETFQGKNTAATRLRHASPAGAEVFVEEEGSKNQEMKHTQEAISIVASPDGPLHNKAGKRIGEAGTLRTDQPGPDHWHSLQFEASYSDPVVFMQIMTHNGKNPSHIRLRNIKSDTCSFQIEEWQYLDGQHTQETIGYIVLEKGSHELSDGTQLHVGTKQSDHTWGDEVRFAPDYKRRKPVIMTQCQTRQGKHEVITRVKGLDTNGFRVRLQEEQARDGEHNAETIGFLAVARPAHMVSKYAADVVPGVRAGNFSPESCGFYFVNAGFSGGYTLPKPIKIPNPASPKPFTIDEIGDATNGMCGGMVYAARDFYEYGRCPWPEDLLDSRPSNSPVNTSVPDEGSKLFDFLSERLFDSFKPGSENKLGAALYQTLMNSANTKKFGQVKKSRNQVMHEQWVDTIKPTINNDHPCPLGLVNVDTHGKPFKTGLNKLGKNHQVLAYGYTKSGNVIDIHVYDPNDPKNTNIRVQFSLKDSLKSWYDPQYIGSSKPIYAFFVPAYSKKKPPSF